MATATTPPPPVALLTRTIVKSPVVRWIVPVKIRHSKLNDVAFVGDGFVEIRQVVKGGHLQTVYTHSSFGSRICAAKAFTVDRDRQGEDDFLDSLATHDDLLHSAVPPELLVLTLESQILMFLYLEQESRGRYKLKTQPVPLPRWPDVRQQVSQHLAVDPQSRALAVAAMEGQVMLFSVKPSADIYREFEQKDEKWCPIKQQRPLPITGVIQHIAFLYPSTTDADHVIFLAVVIDKRRTRLVWFDWLHAGGLEQIRSLDTLAIDSPRCVPSLLIPLAQANFILVHGSTITIFRNLLSRSVAQTQISTIDEQYPALCPGLFASRPMWANWCRPMRNAVAATERDDLYLVREDGKVFLLGIVDAEINANFAGDLECHVGQAFASLGNEIDPDLLAVAGDMSTGRIASIGFWSQHALPQETSRAVALDMTLVQLLPTWSSVTDMVVIPSATSTQNKQSQDSIFVASGRQPYGTISEIRRGLEARIAAHIPLEDARGITDVWTLLHPPDSNVIVLLSTPETTIVLLFSAATNEIDLAPMSTLEVANPTLAADVTTSNHIVQITRAAITITNSLKPGFDDHNKQAYTDGVSVLCATIEPSSGFVLCAEASNAENTIVPYFCDNDDEVGDFLAKAKSLPTGPAFPCTRRPLAVASAVYNGSTFAAVVESGGLCRLFVCQERTLREIHSFQVPHADDDCCESLVILVPGSQEAQRWLKIVGGLRSGRIHHRAVVLTPTVNDELSRTVMLGQSSVKLTRHSSQQTEAVACSGDMTCLLSLDLTDLAGLHIRNIYLTDKARPNLSQGSTCGFTVMPSGDKLPRKSLPGLLGSHQVYLSGNDLNFVELAKDLATVPRQITCQGSPNRILYAHSHRCWINAATICILSTIGGKTYRQTHPVIEFISARPTGTRKTFPLQPGEEIYALLEWTHRAVENKLHSFILAGGMCSSHQDPKGKIYFLRPDMHHVDTEVHSVRPLSFDKPVFALALYDTLTFVVCYGSKIALYRFDTDGRKWRRICEPLALSSRGVAISCAMHEVHVTTSTDAIVVLRVQELPDAYEELTHELSPVSASPRAAIGMSHVVVDCDVGHKMPIAIMTTKEHHVIGMIAANSMSNGVSRPAASKVLFEGELCQSLVRIRDGNFRPSRKGELPAGVLAHNVVGACTDGSIVGMLVVDEHLWRRLFWLQRLCEWASETAEYLSPYTTDNYHVLGEARDLPIGLGNDRGNVVLFTAHGNASRGRDMHIDGDVLANALGDAPIAAVQELITKASERRDDVGAWMREHLEAERAAAEGFVAEVNQLLDAWF